MAFYSRAHYRRVSPRADTPAEIAARRLEREACTLGVSDRAARYPTLTADNAEAALEYQEARIAYHRARLAARA